MNLLMEFIFEVILEGAIEGVKSKKVPKLVRIILFAIILSPFFSIIVLMIYLSLIIDSGPMIKVIFLAVALIIGIFLINLIKEMIKKYKNN
ncbi:hypothetical protein [Senegalia massiliensis]|uniref:hypothetical protein n=1 Tax=Senegalia massiliensis TaxID=1720316 RepID=UPI00102F3E79|nr:hypothetical protein [Senegalia massiliensis]